MKITTSQSSLRMPSWAASVVLALLATGVRAQTVKSVNSGDWMEPQTWEDGIIPGPTNLTDISGHRVVLDAAEVTVSSLEVKSTTVIDSHLILTNSAKLTTSSTTAWSYVVRGARTARMDLFDSELMITNRFMFGRDPLYSSGNNVINVHTGSTFTIGEHFYMTTAGNLLNMRGEAFTVTTHWALGADMSKFPDLPPPTFNHYRGDVFLSYLNLADANHTQGEYHLYSGTMSVGRDLGIRMIHNAREGTPKAILFLGDAQGSGSITQRVANVSLLVGGTSTGAHTRVEGWCDEIDLSGELRNNGRIIANGWGAVADRTLDFRSFGSVVSTYMNAPSNGWFAVNRAKLLLPDLAFTAANSARAWGDTITRPTADLALVNSLHIALTDVTADGSLSIALLAPDRSDVSSAPAATTLLGVWDIEPDQDLAFASADLTIRYDDALAASAGVDGWPGKLRMFRDTGTGWAMVPGSSVDEVNHRISVTNLDGFSQLAVGLFDPPAGTILLVR